MLSAGCYYDPEKWHPPFQERHCLQPAGFYNGDTHTIEPFSHLDIAEHVRYSWFVDPGGGRHPWESETTPAYTTDGEPYSYAKATRYQDQVVQLGPLADLVIAGDPLITSFFMAEGPNTWLRQFTRLHRPVAVLQADAPDGTGVARASRRTDLHTFGTAHGRRWLWSYQRRTGQFGALDQNQATARLRIIR